MPFALPSERVRWLVNDTVHYTDPKHNQEVSSVIQLTESQIGLRVYGGHVFIGGGTLQFIDCMFWDFELLIPFTDRLRIGGDVLVRGGVCVFVCC